MAEQRPVSASVPAGQPVPFPGGEAVPVWGWAAESVEALVKRGLARERRVCLPLRSGRCRMVSFASPNAESPELWNFATNDYLGLAGDSRLLAAAQVALVETGAGARASALIAGRTPWHAELEAALARFKSCEAALLFPSGYAANLSTVAALVGPGDTVLCDRLNHASLIDGCRLSRAKLRVYPHRDLNCLEQELRRADPKQRRLVVTDSLFSMDGDAAPLQEIVNLANRHGAMLLVDEAHATGVFGHRGTGLLEGLSQTENVLVVGTLSKALGAQGGFAAGRQEVIDWLWNSARGQMFSTALTPAACAAALKALEIVEAEPARRSRLLAQAEQLVKKLRSQGWNIPDRVCGPIVPLLVGDAEQAVHCAQQLRDRGCFVPAVRPPTVPERTSRLRISLSAEHSEQAIEELLHALAAVQPRE